MSTQLEDHFKIGVDCCLRSFTKDLNIQGNFRKYFNIWPKYLDFILLEKELPTSLSAQERAYVHQSAKKLGFLSKSRGKGTNRSVTIYKEGSFNYLKNDSKLQVTQTTRKNAMLWVSQNQLTRQEKQDLVPTSERDRLRGKYCFMSKKKDRNTTTST